MKVAIATLCVLVAIQHISAAPRLDDPSVESLRFKRSPKHIHNLLFGGGGHEGHRGGGGGGSSSAAAAAASSGGSSASAAAASSSSHQSETYKFGPFQASFSSGSSASSSSAGGGAGRFNDYGSRGGFGDYGGGSLGSLKVVFTLADSKMKSLVFILFLGVLAVVCAFPKPQSVTESRAKAAASPPGRIPFELSSSIGEIVVASSLTVKGKPAGARSGRTKLMLVTNKPAEIPIEASG
ncbi:hypothetical protein M8J76_001509 [Diaphorina citri]|nr:hypothetical protein M8J76_001509 [Diaphorina citri]